MTSTARDAGTRVWLLLAVAFGCLAVFLFGPQSGLRVSALVAALTLVALAVMLRGLDWWSGFRAGRVTLGLQKLVGQDMTPCFTTNALGQIDFQNKAADERFGAAMGGTLVSALKDNFASPSSVLYRLQSRARMHGSAREDVVTRRGHLRLSVTALAEGRFLWRLEEFSDRSGSGRGAETLSLPMLIANKSGVVLFTNEAMRRLLGERPKRLDRVFGSQRLNSGEEVRVTSVEGPVRAILAEVDGIGERREIYLLPVAERSVGPDELTDFEHVPVALVKFDSDGLVTAINAAARDLTKLAPESTPRITDLFEGLGRSVMDWMGDVLDERLPAGVEVMRLRASVEDVFLQVHLRRIVERGRPCTVALLQDATAMKRLEGQFVQSQKMQAIGQLAGGIAHDFNNLLTAISGHCDMLLLRHTPTDPEYGDLMQIHQNSNRAASLVGQLLAFSRKQTLKPERIDLPDVLSELTHLLNRLVGEKLRLSLSHDPNLQPIRADKRQLEQVIVNLVVNARDAMRDGGTISVSAEAVNLSEEMRRDRVTVPAGSYTLVRVSDTGCGIPPDKQQKIFEPFYTTKGVGEGTGLGLSTVYGIVKQSGGFIFVESALDEGTTFDLYFPADLQKEIAATVLAPVARQTVRRSGGVILLVEDEAPVRAFASRALRMRGYTVVEAGNAEEALAVLEDASLTVDVFVTDVVMPGMNGPSWVREALRTRPDVRVVFVSGYAEDFATEDQESIPNSVFLPKPFSLGDLASTVQAQIH